MARGVFSGLIWGAAVAAAGAGGLSLAYPDFKPTAAMAPADAQGAEQPEGAEPQAQPETSAQAGETETQEPAVATEAAEPELAEEQTPSPEVVVAEEAPEETEPEAPVAEELVEQEPAQEPAAEVADEGRAPAEDDTLAEAAAPEDDSAPLAEDAALPEQDAAEDAPAEVAEEQIAALPQTDGEGTVGNLAPNVTTDRLPSLAEPEELEEGAPSATAPPPIERFAASYTPDTDKPLMAIVLIDEGDAELGVDALESFPYPLTFAVDASKPDAAERMQVYRDKGFEVLALVDLPRGATPADVEVAMTAHIAAVPEAVGFLEGVDTGVQTSREVADQLTQIVLETGHGLLFQASGLNTARKLAEREGVPAGTVFRDFDGNGQSASVMRRFLDQAAFRARQEGGVVMMGRLQGETISALLIWGLADRASRVSLVPVSAVLTQDSAE